MWTECGTSFDRIWIEHGSDVDNIWKQFRFKINIEEPIWIEFQTNVECEMSVEPMWIQCGINNFFSCCGKNHLKSSKDGWPKQLELR
jgi:hypothetical protein